MNQHVSVSSIQLGLIAIARYRFRLFEKEFRREPGPHDPIFFDESSRNPVQADVETSRRQLVDAAQASGVEPEPILKFLGFARMIAGVAALTALEF
jgi:hypothetical protein